MVDDVKSPKRTYREEQAQATKDRICAAARRLFADQGYRMTSVAAIAAEAGVAERTVYAAFGAKREILSAICETWLEDAHARELVAAAVDEPDPLGTLRLAARFLRALFETGYDVMVLFDAASAEDPQTRAMLRAKLEGRNHVQNLIIDSVKDHLVVPLPAAQAVYRALAAVGVYQELVVESGWTIDQYEQWVLTQLAGQLLGVPADQFP
ncbi:TetR/AcrR family transcriptional regulator [Phycicoccus sp.]|uniref:TetR/AcrR family transcriptional regulator n=1 Tax=Phycicoccus sp. TaxID=1902410 RepID=UPI002BB01E82|nr:TetR/AcrR family transcriptional regulator [Phycicoccus sp.]HMM96247.1 TetR/AcrR family transcriptional regulator [Phycicoccus sp.]